MSKRSFFQVAQKTMSALSNQPAASHDNKSMDFIQLYHDLYDESPETRILCGEARFKELLESLTFGGLTTVHELKITKGICRRKDVECAELVETAPDPDAGGRCELQVLFLKPFMRNAVTLSPTSFFQLLKATGASPSYLEVLMDNNGLYSSLTVPGPNDAPTDYYIFIKYPFGPFANGSFMLHHHFHTGKTSVVIEVPNTQLLAERTFELFSTPYYSTTSGLPHPLVPLALFVDHLRCLNEDERVDIDKSIRHLESRSGVALHNFGSRTRARISEFAVLKEELHMKEALMAMADHIFSFQMKMVAFAIGESGNFHALLQPLFTNTSTHRQVNFVKACLSLNGSMATWTVAQLHSLRERLRVQAKVVDGTITATDTLTMIRLAQNSQSDSNTMKAITVLTMIFLPAIFVCSLFSMGFFNFQTSPSELKFQVASQFWIYFAVAIPLTVVVLGICAAWLRRSGRDGDSISEFPTK
ncbi:uncharacterized protein A1O9_12501 [Exophiala aquamarina CBS 119918]|uniref:Uncharacterized protein n=1 Tax=Exophiala aquamarina CBS 119918 TaxID=1182545 RepID=A0A072NUM7_9EURO|nr:uncharacterized protein A1O9_12501 [Exophiala aquamarina CBS 119918]KEF51584.1 hypothetical protein A1O9_12501 [Exophiala aquamarina CBS 119918]